MKNISSDLKIVSHSHIHEKSVKWYCNILDYLVQSEKAIEDLFFVNRWRANKIHKKRSKCKACYETFSKYFNENIPENK